MSADNHQVPIEIRGLTKHFGSVRALDGLDLTVREGEVHGFLGPNGAGKSTTLRILLGLVKADGGSVRLLGGDPWTDAVDLHRHIAYVPGDVTLWPSLTGGERPGRAGIGGNGFGGHRLGIERGQCRRGSPNHRDAGRLCR